MTLIDVSKLEKNKTYICLEIGCGIAARFIQKLEHKIYKDIPIEQLASHAFAIAYDGTDFYVYENHLCWNGVRKYTIDEYNKNNKNPILIIPYELDINRLEYYVKFNPGYSCIQLAEDTTERLIGIKIPNASGMVCSEYIAACFKSFELCYKINQPYMFITPVDLQNLSTLVF